ncbi:hypothetical protein ACNTMW_33040 [Planosporangium sp. 12N6]|uniref:hypothetical protein n=1 Tax=Planosporangium spinosum TaxID=3402278 RepID=UPI003CF107F1
MTSGGGRPILLKGGKRLVPRDEGVACGVDAARTYGRTSGRSDDGIGYPAHGGRCYSYNGDTVGNQSV